MFSIRPRHAWWFRRSPPSPSAFAISSWSVLLSGVNLKTLVKQTFFLLIIVSGCLLLASIYYVSYDGDGGGQSSSSWNSLDSSIDSTSMPLSPRTKHEDNRNEPMIPVELLVLSQNQTKDLTLSPSKWSKWFRSWVLLSGLSINTSRWIDTAQQAKPSNDQNNDSLKIDRYFWTGKASVDRSLPRTSSSLSSLDEEASQKLQLDQLIDKVYKQSQSTFLDCDIHNVRTIHLPTTQSSLLHDETIGVSNNHHHHHHHSSIQFSRWRNFSKTFAILNPCDVIVIDSQQHPPTTTIRQDDQRLFQENLTPKKLTSSGRKSIAQIFQFGFKQFDKIFGNFDSLCHLFDQIRKYPVSNHHPLTPLCLTLPHHLQQFLDVSDALGYSTKWTLFYQAGGGGQLGAKRSSSPFITKIEPINVFSQTTRSHLIQLNRLALKKFLTTNQSPLLIKQHLSQQVIRHKNHPARLRLFVLVTSLNPLRVLVYKRGLILPYTQNSLEQNLYLDSLEGFWSMIEQRFDGIPQLSQAKQAVSRSVLYAMLVLEVGSRLLLLDDEKTDLPKPYGNSYGKPSIDQTFQWFAIDVVLQRIDEFQASIVDIFPIYHDPNPASQLEPNYFNHQNDSKSELWKSFQRDTYQLLLELTQNTTEQNAVRNQIRLKIKSLLLAKRRENVLGLLGIDCHISHRICLSDFDLQWIFSTRYQFELAQEFDFDPLYPVTMHQQPQDKHDLQALLEQILIHLDQQQLQQSQSITTQRRKRLKEKRNNNQPNRLTFEPGTKNDGTITQINFDYQTERLHSIVEYVFVGSNSLSSSTKTIDQQQHTELFDEHDLTNMNRSQSLSDDYKSLTCSKNDSHEWSYMLTKLQIVYPENLNLWPPFEPSQFYYQANQSANHWSVLVSIVVEVGHCDTWIQLDDGAFYAQSGTLNFSLGLGRNQLKFTLIDRHTSAVLSVYSIVVHRLSREEQYSLIQTFRAGSKERFTICQLEQDCDLPVYPSMSCGLQPAIVESSNQKPKHFERAQIESSSWFEQMINAEGEKECQDGAVSGRWLVPCLGGCNEERLCWWRSINWLPLGCRYSIPTNSNRIDECLAKTKNILMIGDSTNRGILHYIMERLNRTLTEADKTHNYKTYRLNNNNNLTTSFSFAYYPKFWLAPTERPSFAQVFRNLIQIFHTDNTTQRQNVVVFGGVQWISRQHLHIAKQELQKQGLENRVRLMVKTLGSGFHQPVVGVHYMSLSEQMKLAQLNQLLVADARRLKIEPIDTFNKTIALFKDFYPGRCACHFHQVKQVKISGHSNGNHHHHHHDDPEASSQKKRLYHVEGSLNKLYSEILLSRLCSI